MFYSATGEIENFENDNNIQINKSQEYNKNILASQEQIKLLESQLFKISEETLKILNSQQTLVNNNQQTLVNNNQQILVNNNQQTSVNNNQQTSEQLNEFKEYIVMIEKRYKYLVNRLINEYKLKDIKKIDILTQTKQKEINLLNEYINKYNKEPDLLKKNILITEHQQKANDLGIQIIKDAEQIKGYIELEQLESYIQQINEYYQQELIKLNNEVKQPNQLLIIKKQQLENYKNKEINLVKEYINKYNIEQDIFKKNILIKEYYEKQIKLKFDIYLQKINNEYNLEFIKLNNEYTQNKKGLNNTNKQKLEKDYNVKIQELKNNNMREINLLNNYINKVTLEKDLLKKNILLKEYQQMQNKFKKNITRL